MSLNSFRSGMGRVTSTTTGKAILFTIGAILVFSLVYSGLGTNLGGRNSASPAGSGDDTVATVNGTAITRAEYEQTLNNEQQQMQQMGGQTPSPMQSYLYDDAALEELISDQLQVAQAQKMGFTVSSAEIAQARQQAADQYQIPTKLGLPATATVSQIDEALGKVSNQTLEDMFPDDALRQTILLGKIHASFAKPVTPSDAQAFYKEYHTQHILISNTKVSDVQAQNEAQQILLKAKAPGANFGALAKQFSDDPGTKSKGGDDGWIGEDNNFNNYIPEFVQAVQSLQPGEITPAPVKTPQFGYFIIKLDAVRENLPKDFTKNQAQYLGQIAQQQQQTAYQNFLTSLKSAPGNKIVVTDLALRGDQAMAQAQQAAPTQRAANLQAAVTAYTQALKTATPADTGDINAGLAQAYQGLSETPQAIAAYKAAVDATHDEQIELALAQLYQQTKDIPDAIAQYQAASQQAYSDPNVHQQIAAAYTAMQRPDLAAKETALASQIQKQQQQASSTAPGGLPPGLSLQPPTAGGSAPPQTVTVNGGSPQSVTVKPASGKSPKPSHAPAQ